MIFTRASRVPLVHLEASKFSFIRPANDRAIDSSRENEFLFNVKGAAHDVILVHQGGTEWGQIHALNGIILLIIASVQ